MGVALVTAVSATATPAAAAGGTALGIAAGADLLAAYGMEEGTSSTVRDLSGNGHDGDVRDPLWVDGKIGKALRFDGAAELSRVLTVPDAPGLRPGSALTVEAWVKAETEESCDIWAKVIDGQEVSYHVGTAWFMTRIGGLDQGSYSYAPPGEWFHLALTYDGATLKLFGNGEEGPSIPVTGTIDYGSGPLLIGQGADNCFRGVVDEVRVYGRALTSDEIQADMDTAVMPNARPSAPSNLSADVSSGTAELSWDAATDDSGVTGYEIYRSDQGDFDPSDLTRVATVTGTTFTEGCVVRGTYFYRVVALDTLRQPGPASDAISAQIDKPDCPPSAPSVQAKPYNGWVKITLGSGSDERGVTERQLHRSTTADFTPTPGTLLATFKPTPTNTYTDYIDYPDAPGTYYYRTLAVDTASHVSEPSPAESAAVRAAPDLQASLMGAYTFDEGSGTSVRDSSPKRHDGALSDGGGFLLLPTWVDGKHGKALSFRGGGFMEARSFYASGQVTISAWVKRTDSERVTGGFINQWIGTDTHLTMSSSGGVDGEPTAYPSHWNRLGGPAPIPVGVWTHLAAVLDIPSNSYQFYINGEMVGSKYHDGSFSGSSELTIGGGDDHRGLVVDEVRTYDAALTPRQIKTIMNTPIG